MLSRAFMRLVDLLPVPSQRVQRLIALAVVITQAGIAVTGAVVRVTASGLGCPTWPKCFPGSFTPVPHAATGYHQAIEFSNRLLTFVVTVAAAAVVLAVLRARRRREVVAYAWLMPGGTVLQAVLGGITVRAGLLWWTVSIHMLASMLMVWLAGVLWVKVAEPDDGVVVTQAPAPLRALTVLSGIALAATLVAGTLVTGAGPHAGDKSVDKTVPRLQVEIPTLVHAHAELLVAYLCLLIGLGFGLATVGVTRTVRTHYIVVLALVCAQALIGVVQYFTDVPGGLVVLHVAGAGACTAATAALWATLRTREHVPAPVTEVATTR
ncbi:COX15/CtaA family protein [Nocardia stercoris]|uniref:Heme A synthase n=1 Tax=Nocardia stercoris TaxID=2483361 RepID=A0A3M2KXQ2_9NOCA|nr:COX15/CtaA family protein [Nocardia stercoris]RMI30289.1 heme A synthase [Nocardia stercoris]